MNLVVDTSTVIAITTNEPQKAALVAQTQDAELFAPRSLHHEIGNAFAAMFRRGRITLAEAETAVTLYGQIPVNWVEIDLRDALRLAHHLNIYAYDAYMIACALHVHCPIITVDKGLKTAAQKVGIPVLDGISHANLP